MLKEAVFLIAWYKYTFKSLSEPGKKEEQSTLEREINCSNLNNRPTILFFFELSLFSWFTLILV